MNFKDELFTDLPVLPPSLSLSLSSLSFLAFLLPRRNEISRSRVDSLYIVPLLDKFSPWTVISFPVSRGTIFIKYGTEEIDNVRAFSLSFSFFSDGLLTYHPPSF